MDEGRERGIEQMRRSAQLLRRVRRRGLPDWASEFDCSNWAQLFLKYILAEPAALA